jgi:regulator of ribonuclease activity A
VTSTADLCDDGATEPLDGPWIRFGAVPSIDAVTETVRVGDSNRIVREVLDEPGRGRILVVAGGGRHARYALVGDRLAALAIAREWTGVVVDGLVRDADRLARLEIGIWARGTTPRRGPVDGPGEHGVEIRLAGRRIRPGARLAADGDGVVVE